MTSIPGAHCNMSRSFVNSKYAGRDSAYAEHGAVMKRLHDYFVPHHDQLFKDIEADWPLRCDCRVSALKNLMKRAVLKVYDSIPISHATIGINQCPWW
jgi:hypothetical protein